MQEAPSTKAMEIFSDAATTDSSNRDAYLERACAGDAKLRAEVESLLATNQRIGEFLDSPELSETDLDAGAGEDIYPDAGMIERAPEQVGRYKIEERIGEGGFGVVYRAVQTHPIRREVALKIIKLGMDTRQVIARFEAERQALALMDHQNIAKVYDAGATESGRPYFVMELVHGVPITEYCDKNQLAPRQRLELFVQVCKAVQHAHTKGVIHRDIKPTNVLVTLHEGVAVPKVIDFGVAKATGQQLTDMTVFTKVAQMVGTPLYMSPEQAEMSAVDVDTRSDVYSLGVLLYELLTGTTPVDGERLKKAAFDEVRRIIREEEPPAPSTRLSTMGEKLTTVSTQRKADPRKLPRLMRGELDWIVMKALEKDRNRRYETANAFARDVERFLGDEAVLARPQSGLYRFRKLVRRNKLKFAAVASMATALLLATAFSTWMFLEEREARRHAVFLEREQERLRQRAETAHANEARLRQQAEAQEKKALVEGAKSQQVADFLKDLLRGAAPFVAQGRDTTILREIVNQTADRIGKDLQEQPDVEAELRIILGEVYRDLAEHKKAEEMLRRALQLKRQRLGDQHGEVAVALNSLAAVRLSQRHLEDAESLHREALAIRRNVHGPNHPLLAETLDNLGLVLHHQWKNGDAEPLYREALAIRRAAFGDEHAAVALSLSNLAVLLRVEGRLDESEAAHREALAIRRKLLSNEHPDVAISINGLGNLLRDKGMLAEAEAMFREALAIRRKIYGEVHPYVVQTMGHLSVCLFWQGKDADADACLDEAHAIQRRARSLPATLTPGEQKAALIGKGNTYMNFAREANRQGKIDIEERAARRAIQLDPNNGSAHYHLGHAMEEKGRFDEAIASYRQCVVLEPTQVMPRKRLIDALSAKGYSADQVTAYMEKVRVEGVAHAAARAASQPSTTRPATAAVKTVAAGDDLLALGRESPEGVARAVEKARAIDPDATALTPLKRLILGEYLVLGGNAEKGAAAIQRAVEEVQKKGKVPSFYHKSLGWALLTGGRREEAAAAFRRALPLGGSTKPSTQPAGADPDEWTAAYFLDQITQEQYTTRWNPTKAAAMAWFHVGHRAELEGREDAAIAAYRKSIELGAAAGGGQQTSNWAAYRLDLLTGSAQRPAQE